MLGKDLKKEGWIRFEDDGDLEEEYDQEEIDTMVYEAYKHSVMYGGIKNVNKKLKERFDTLDKRTKRITTIKKVAILRNIKMENRREAFTQTYLVVEDERGIALLLDIKRGYDESFQYNRTLSLTKNSKIEKLYSAMPPTYIGDLNISFIDKVLLYKNVTLKNTVSNVKIPSKYLLQITDQNNLTIYINISKEEILVDRDNYEIELNPNTKITKVFQKEKTIVLRNKLL